jgi:hypothetical protein
LQEPDDFLALSLLRRRQLKKRGMRWCVGGALGGGPVLG